MLTNVVGENYDYLLLIRVAAINPPIFSKTAYVEEPTNGCYAITMKIGVD